MPYVPFLFLSKLDSARVFSTLLALLLVLIAKGQQSPTANEGTYRATIDVLHQAEKVPVAGHRVTRAETLMLLSCVLVVCQVA